MNKDASKGAANSAGSTGTDNTERPQPGKEATRKQATVQEFYTPKQIAKSWVCSEKHVRRLIASGALPAHKFGGIVRVSADDRIRLERSSRIV